MNRKYDAINKLKHGLSIVSYREDTYLPEQKILTPFPNTSSIAVRFAGGLRMEAAAEVETSARIWSGAI